ncbi:MAG: CAP domain-containing protein [Desulfobulbus sp.]|nr:CAP domain-containing protein [Desulfobulbus sp.]
MKDEGASLYARTLLEQINRYRYDRGLESLRFDANLIRLARHHSFEMFRQKIMSHRNFDQRFQRSGSRMCVENVGWNFSVPLKQFDAWRQSRDHDQNMLKEGVTKVGIAEVGNYVTFFACK